MNRSKRRSRRLALYLLCIGVRPWPADLQAQYNALEPGQRNLARKSGRRLIKEEGALTRALKYISRRWPALTPPCPSCRMGAAFPSVPWPPGNGLKRFGEDSTITTYSVFTRVQSSQASVISATRTENPKAEGTAAERRANKDQGRGGPR
jgi:hypothetical protein